jgi:Thiamine pyrophosphate enzyme, N-terminal TPP binding domain
MHTAPSPEAANGSHRLRTVADLVVATLRASGVRRVYGLPGDSLNAFTDALRRDGELAWEHVRHAPRGYDAAAVEARPADLRARTRNSIARFSHAKPSGLSSLLTKFDDPPKERVNRSPAAPRAPTRRR